MSNLRESIGSAVNAGSMLMEDETERAVDRGAALALTETLGSLLWRLKYGDQKQYREITVEGMSPPAFTRTALKLERWLTKKEARWSTLNGCELYGRFVRLALADWLHDKCQGCHGRGMVGLDRQVAKSVRVRCPNCAGKGATHRYTPRGHLLQRICPRCCGNGAIGAMRVISPEKPRACPHCHGLGIAIITTAAGCAVVGVSDEQ